MRKKWFLLLVSITATIFMQMPIFAQAVENQNCGQQSCGLYLQTTGSSQSASNTTSVTAVLNQTAQNKQLVASSPAMSSWLADSVDSNTGNNWVLWLALAIFTLAGILGLLLLDMVLWDGRLRGYVFRGRRSKT